jgi:hypothetical protein
MKQFWQDLPYGKRVFLCLYSAISLILIYGLYLNQAGRLSNSLAAFFGFDFLLFAALSLGAMATSGS